MGGRGIERLDRADFDHFAKEAYAVYPQGEGVDVKPSEYDIRFGLAQVDAKGKATGQHIAYLAGTLLQHMLHIDLVGPIA